MLPPETMQTILPAPALPDNAHATEQAPAPSAIMRFRPDSNLIAKRILSRLATS